MRRGCIGGSFYAMHDTMRIIEDNNYTAPARPGFYDFAANTPEDE